MVILMFAKQTMIEKWWQYRQDDFEASLFVLAHVDHTLGCIVARWTWRDEVFARSRGFGFLFVDQILISISRIEIAGIICFLFDETCVDRYTKHLSTAFASPRYISNRHFSPHNRHEKACTVWSVLTMEFRVSLYTRIALRNYNNCISCTHSCAITECLPAAIYMLVHLVLCGLCGIRISIYVIE